MSYISHFIFSFCFILSHSNTVLANEKLGVNFTSIEKFGEELAGQPTFKVWKNEMLPLILKIKSAKHEPINLEIKLDNSKIDICPYQLEYVIGDFSAGVCGIQKEEGGYATGKFPDRTVEITNNTFQPDSVVHYVLIHLTVDGKSKPGNYPITIQLNQNGETATATARIEVSDRKLPDFDKLDFKIDFWQYPLSVANYYKIKPYDQKHMDHLDIMFKQLRYINQNVITTSVFWDLFNTSVKPMDQMMIQVRKKANGSYTYDYTNFEKYVKLGLANGIDEQISVHNLFPWNNFFFYFDEVKNEVAAVQTLPLSEDYNLFWTLFLKDFSSYLKKMGWMKKTVLIIDERDEMETLGVAKFIKDNNPDFKIGYAGRFNPELSPYIADYSLPINVVLEDEFFQARKKLGHQTTLYTSCYESQPNLLMMSNYADIYFIIMLAKAKGYDGMLRWAFNLWSDQIMDNAIYTDLPSGDAHFVYPHGQVSLRYWLIRDALEEVLKMEYKEKESVAKDVLKAHNRFFLLNIEQSRLEMISTLKNYLND